ncbi:hypothetical protein [Curtobacterium sp. Leaf261]|uniref:hypothetical protein n=1 Tax=Curtobacterium sp. Leaf261 TaxID=1736311 RepID=UPI0006FDCB83|nr:hypothetical protein [Curtobacterium sp. Leaf261]KQO61388.1 hypothetical protein ASF23_12995 [Curtobacterium sp. Leaf261]
MHAFIKAGIIGAVAIGAVAVGTAPASAATTPAPARLAGSFIATNGSAFVPIVGGDANALAAGAPTSYAAAKSAATRVSIPDVGTSGPVVVGDRCVTGVPLLLTLGACDVDAPAQTFRTTQNDDGSFALHQHRVTTGTDALLSVLQSRGVLAPSGYAGAPQAIVPATFAPSTTPVPGGETVQPPKQAEAQLVNPRAVHYGTDVVLSGKANAGATVTASIGGKVVAATTIPDGKGIVVFGLPIPVTAGDTQVLVTVTTVDGATTSATVAL